MQKTFRAATPVTTREFIGRIYWVNLIYRGMSTSREKLKQQHQHLMQMPLAEQERLDLLSSRHNIIQMAGLGLVLGAFLGYMLAPMRNQFTAPSITRGYKLAYTSLFSMFGALVGTALSVQYNVDNLSKKENRLGEELRRLYKMRNEFRRSGGNTTNLTPEAELERELQQSTAFNHEQCLSM